jgi:chromosome segregation ATPase
MAIACAFAYESLDAMSGKKKEKEPEPARELTHLNKRLDELPEDLLILRETQDLREKSACAKIMLNSLCDSLEEAIKQQGKRVLFNPMPLKQYIQRYFIVHTQTDLEQQVAKERESLLARYRQEAHDYQEKAHSMIAKLQEQNRELDQKIHTLEKALTKPQQELAQDKKELQTTISGLKIDIENLRRTLADREQDLVYFRQNKANLEAQIEDLHTLPSEHIAPSTAFTLGTLTGAAASAGVYYLVQRFSHR